jgi:hypothetical protein
MAAQGRADGEAGFSPQPQRHFQTEPLSRHGRVASMDSLKATFYALWVWIELS